MFNLIAVWIIAFADVTATIQGVVRAQGTREPVPFATVSIPALGRSVQTDVHGLFVLSGISAGRWRVQAGALGYRPNSIEIVTGESGNVRLDFELEVRPVLLPGVTAESNDSADALNTGFESGPAPSRMTAEALKLVPGLAEADVLRALQALPSVSAMSDYSSALYVRGGSADQNLIQIDGTPLFNPYHVGGVFSAIAADAVSTVDVWPGALPARVGDRIASAVVINTREGEKDRVRTSGSLGLISTTLTADGPLNKGNGSFLLSGRRTYIDAITDIGYKLGAIDFTMPYGFDDAYGKLTHRVGDLGSLSISGYWNGESIEIPERMRESLDDWGEFGWGSHMISATYRQPITGSVLLELHAARTAFNGTFDGWAVRHEGGGVCDQIGCHFENTDTIRAIDAHTRTRDHLFGLHLTTFQNTHTGRAGLQNDRYVFDHELTAIDTDTSYISPFADRHDLSTLAAYIEDEWRSTDHLNVRAGARVLTGGGLGTAWLPRLGVRWQVTPRITLSAGGGAYAQALRTMKDDESVAASVIAYDILTPQPADAGWLRGTDFVAGGEYASSGVTLRLDAYAKTIRNLVLPPVPEEPLNAKPLVNESYRVGSGNAQGVELSARKVSNRVDLGIAYALSFAERRAGDDVFAPRFLRTHQLDISATYKRGTRSVYSARMIAASGQPYTPVEGISQPLAFNPATQTWQFSYNRAILGEHNAGRLPSYFRVDLAARKTYEREWFGRRGTLVPYLQVINVLNNKNALVADVQAYNRTTIGYLPQFPIIPTFGVEWRF
jgi:hypothetical protein